MSEKEECGLRARLRARYGSGVGRGEMVVWRGVGGVTVYGCRKILLYSPREIRLCMSERILSVAGEGLFCSSFSAGAVSICGSITSVSVGQEVRRRG